MPGWLLKAFDGVKPEKMIKLLKKTGIEDKDMGIIGSLYWNQINNLRVEREDTEYVKSDSVAYFYFLSSTSTQNASLMKP